MPVLPHVQEHSWALLLLPLAILPLVPEKHPGKETGRLGGILLSIPPHTPPATAGPLEPHSP